MTRTDKIWLVTAPPLFVLMLMIMLRVFSYDRSIAGSREFKGEQYSIELDGGEFTGFWRNFYRIKKESPEKPLFIRVLSREDLIYAMVNFEVKGIAPSRARLSGAAFTEIYKFFNTIKFSIRAGSRKDITLRIQEEDPTVARRDR